MKLSTWHKGKGDEVSWFSPIRVKEYDLIYSSKVFSFSGNDPYIPDWSIKGGTGYGMFNSLPEEVEHLCPDYDLYNMECSMGFITRGCIRNCPWCIVPEKEGRIRVVSDIREFLRHKKVILLDNNILASEEAVGKIFPDLISLGVKVDFNQGFDARLIDATISKLLAKMKWTDFIRLACDSQEMKIAVERAVGFMRRAGVRERYMCYCLIGDDLEEAYDRIMFIRGLGVDPYASPYRDFSSDYIIPWKVQAFARWVNRKALFYSVSWEKYLKENY